MRFRRRSRRRQYSPEQNFTSPVAPVSPVIDFFSNRFDFGRLPLSSINPFYCHGNEIRDQIYVNGHSGSQVRTHVPKCLGIGMSYSDILQGNRPDNFSSDCWLQDCLHRFGFVQTGSNEESDMNHGEEIEEDDSPVGSETGSQREISSLVDIHTENNESMDGLFEIPCRMIDITGYTQVLEPPPYNHPDYPPPTYEEAVGISERRSNRSSSSSSSDIGFLW